MQPTLVLGVSGSVAAYRAADLARELMRSGFVVRVCLTDSAAKFVTPALFEALTGQPCLVGAFEEPQHGAMAHITWAREASVVVVAPASANTLVNLANGNAVDMLMTIAVATEAPIVIAPAMNPTMYASESTQAALSKLSARAAAIVEPEVGDVACGENGQGKFPAIGRIVEQVLIVAQRSKKLAGKRVLITSGPTEEPIDMARFISNRSSGKMGSALARAARLMGAEVVMVAGPQEATIPAGVTLIRVRTAEEMLQAARANLEGMDFVIGAAAVADYRPREPFDGKLRRTSEPMNLELVPNPDVIATLASEAPAKCRVVGFAAEPSGDPAVARTKLAKKQLHAIVLNDVSNPSIGFHSDENELALITADAVSESGRMSKLAAAFWLWEQLA